MNTLNSLTQEYALEIYNREETKRDFTPKNGADIFGRDKMSCYEHDIEYLEPKNSFVRKRCRGLTQKFDLDTFYLVFEFKYNESQKLFQTTIENK